MDCTVELISNNCRAVGAQSVGTWQTKGRWLKSYYNAPRALYILAAPPWAANMVLLLGWVKCRIVAGSSPRREGSVDWYLERSHFTAMVSLSKQPCDRGFIQSVVSVIVWIWSFILMLNNICFLSIKQASMILETIFIWIYFCDIYPLDSNSSKSLLYGLSPMWM